MPAAKIKKRSKKSINSASTAVLQWLSCSFWGWTIISIGYLTWLVTGYMTNNSYSLASPETIPSAVAAVIILLVVSIICDLSYSKREDEQKSGIAMVIMLIHAVIFGLLTVGSFIGIVFGIIRLFVTTGSIIPHQILIATSIILFLLYLITLVRVVRPFASVKFRLIYRVLMSLIAVCAIAAAIIGPVAESVKTKNDRAVAAAVAPLASSIRTFTREQARLPTSLEEVNLTDKESTLGFVRKGLITYKPDIRKATENSTSTAKYVTTTKTLYYQLCANYQYAVTATQSITPSRTSQTHSAGPSCQVLSVVVSDRKAIQ